MPEANINCRRCQTAMLPGYIPDTSRKLVYQTQWYRGVPKERIWRGKTYGIEDTKDGLSMIALRCPSCGAMALNAPAAAAAAQQPEQLTQQPEQLTKPPEEKPKDGGN